MIVQEDTTNAGINPSITTILFTKKNSIYKELNTDTWDITRDATKYTGTEPVIAHPPCRAWGNYRHMAKPTPGEKYLAIWAIRKIRQNGGVLEHPKGSTLWKRLKLPKGKDQPDHWGGWTLNIDQKWFGHRAKKNTNLYIVGTTKKNIPGIPITLEKHITTIENMGKPEREKTPKALAIWLIQLIEIIKMNKKEQNKRTIKN